MKKVYINGYFTKENINGVPRYAIEIVKRLDQYIKPGEAELVIPPDANNVPELNNIKIRTLKSKKSKKKFDGPVWGIFVYGPYVRSQRGINVNFSNRIEFVKNSITMLHDTIQLHKENYYYIFKLSFKENIKTKVEQFENLIWYKAKVFIKSHTALNIVTVSEFSKTEICKDTKFDSNNVKVIGNGWEHVKDIVEYDEEMDSRIIKDKYFFFIGNLHPHKNLKWIFDEAELMQDEYFVIAGKLPYSITETLRQKRNNIIFLGHISDEYMKYLIMNCKALLYPSYIEGFGIPPMEALALGRRAIVSDIPVMHEIYKDSVYYINPNVGNIDLNKLLSYRVDTAEKILSDYSWEKSAKKWFELIDNLRQ